MMRVGFFLSLDRSPIAFYTIIGDSSVSDRFFGTKKSFIAHEGRRDRFTAKG